MTSWLATARYKKQGGGGHQISILGAMQAYNYTQTTFFFYVWVGSQQNEKSGLVT